MMEIYVSIKELLENRSFPNGGKSLFTIARDAILKGNIISIDMTGVDSFPTIFMNTSFGDLIDDFGIEKTKKSFRFKNITRTQIERLNKYFNDYDNLLIEKRLELYIPNRGGAFLNAGEAPPLQKTLYSIDNNLYIEPMVGHYQVKSKLTNNILSDAFTSLRDLIKWCESTYNIQLMPDITK